MAMHRHFGRSAAFRPNARQTLLHPALAATAGLTMEESFLIDTDHPLAPEELKLLTTLLGELGSESQLPPGTVVDIGPRLAVRTPWSSTLGSILDACGLQGIRRIERFRRFTAADPSVTIDDETLRRLYDPLTEDYYRQSITAFMAGERGALARTINVLAEGLPALQAFNRDHRLGLRVELLLYIYEHFTAARRNPTDVELYGLAQLWSEHCRHHIFKARFVINGESQMYSLFDLIRQTHQRHPGDVKVAYVDNANAVGDHEVLWLAPSNPTTASPYVQSVVRYAITFKAETHNHPSTVEAFEGAATGEGGKLRDTWAMGRGGILLAGLFGLYTDHLCIPGYLLPWENQIVPTPPGFRTPLQIAIEASNGAFDYGNKIGEPILGGTFRAGGLVVNGRHRAHRKTIVVVGGIGLTRTDQLIKKTPQPSWPIVHLGGPAMCVGVGGATGSSQNQGSQSTALDLASVQRGDAEMASRVRDAIRACVELGATSPIAAIGDLGAGGISTAWPEAIELCGARYDLRARTIADDTMPAWAVYINESQEGMLIVAWPERLTTLQKLCERFRCPMQVVGTVTDDHKYVVVDTAAPADSHLREFVPVSLPTDFLFAKLPQREISCTRVPRTLPPLSLPSNLTALRLLDRLLRLPIVASKEWLTTAVDRGVGGLVMRQQGVGPHDLPLADVAVTALDYEGTVGAAMALGEQPMIGLVKTAAGVRMSVAEALLNMCGAPVLAFDKISFSATWQWAFGEDEDKAELYDAVVAANEIMQALGLNISVGKDSLSMTMNALTADGQPHKIVAPNTVQMIAHATVSDVRRVLTPNLKRPGTSVLLFLDLAKGKRRLGGSALAQVFDQLGDVCPDVDDPQQLVNGFQAIQRLNATGLLLSVHDRSDGGLLTTLLEMAFAGNCGLAVKFPAGLHVTDDPWAFLFCEEMGLVLEVAASNESRVRSILGEYGLDQITWTVGAPIDEDLVIVRTASDSGDQDLLLESMTGLRSIWRGTSFHLARFKTEQPLLVDEWATSTFSRQVPSWNLTYVPRSPAIGVGTRVPVAILVEEGTNAHREMAAMFRLAGCEPWDVHMTDLVSGRITLDSFQGLVFPGGFSFADVGGSAAGWAAVFRGNSRARASLDAFVARPDTFILGVCNGCQLMARLGILLPELAFDLRPQLHHNRSGRFESRFPVVEIQSSPAICFRGMTGSRLGLWSRHGEGRFHLSPAAATIIADQHLVALRYVGPDNRPTEQYPWNPNGSPGGIAALTSPDGRYTMMMPHWESFPLGNCQLPYLPPALQAVKEPIWLQVAHNLADFCRQA